MSAPVGNTESASRARRVSRILAGIAGLVLAGFALLVLVGQFRWGLDPIGASIASSAGTTAVLCGWYAARGHAAESRRRMSFALAGGLVLGGIGFAAGFFGPIVFTPEANQGPLLGIFVTGPLGFVLGVPIGWLLSRVRPGGP